MFKKLLGTIKDGSISAIASTVSQLSELKTEVAGRINQTDEISDDRFYAIAEEEVDNGTYDRGLWSKALINANGNENMRKIEYMKLRVNQLQQYQLAAVKDQRAYVASALTVGPATPAIILKKTWGDQTLQTCMNHLDERGYLSTFDGDVISILDPHGSRHFLRGKEELFLFMEREFGSYE